MTAVQWTTRSEGDRPTAPAADFDALFLSGYSRLVRTVTVVCGDPDTAAECVADAFERAYARWRRVGSLDDPLGWVRRVAINRATDVHRRTERGRRALQRLGGRPASVSRHDAPVTDSFAFRDSELAAAVAALTGRQRAVVALHYLDDMSVVEVAAALALSEGAVKFHLHQARASLRSALRSDDEVPADGN